MSPEITYATQSVGYYRQLKRVTAKLTDHQDT